MRSSPIIFRVPNPPGTTTMSGRGMSSQAASATIAPACDSSCTGPASGPSQRTCVSGSASSTW